MTTIEPFPFGANWRRFLAQVDEERIRAAEHSLREMLDVRDLSGRTFLDVGSGSGLFSLAARRLGARVRSFDNDRESVAVTAELKSRYSPGDPDWTIEQASVLDRAYLAGLGSFDVVYSWGVLHHTGAMWEALENVTLPVARRGVLFLAIYNDQGKISDYWRAVKRTYNRNRPLRGAVLVLHTPYFLARALARAATGGRRPMRGMPLWRDMVDWLGGHPFEVAKAEEIVRFYEASGFVPRKVVTVGRRHGCNQFVLVKT